MDFACNVDVHFDGPLVSGFNLNKANKKPETLIGIPVGRKSERPFMFATLQLAGLVSFFVVS